MLRAAVAAGRVVDDPGTDCAGAEDRHAEKTRGSLAGSRARVRTARPTWLPPGGAAFLRREGSSAGQEPAPLPGRAVEDLVGAILTTSFLGSSVSSSAASRLGSSASSSPAFGWDWRHCHFCHWRFPFRFGAA